MLVSSEVFTEHTFSWREKGRVCKQNMKIAVYHLSEFQMKLLSTQSGLGALINTVAALDQD